MSKQLSNKKSTQKSKGSNSGPSRRKGKRQNQQKNAMISGRGDQFGAPVAVSMKQTSMKPTIRYASGNCRIAHREFVGSVVSTNGGFQQSLSLRANPGSFQTFSWLCNMATGFETFRFRKLRFIFVTRVPSSTTGAILMSPDYDATDARPKNEIQLSTAEDTVEDSVWKTIVLELNPARLNNSYKSHFVMSDSRFENTASDKKTIDPARIYVMNDSTYNGSLGKLWVEYDVDLMTPQPVTDPPQSGGSVNDFTLNASGYLKAITQNNQEISPVFVPTTSGFPTTNIGTFLRDWSGMITTAMGGTGITANPRLNLNGGPALGLLDGLDQINSAGTQGWTSSECNARAGDILYYAAGAATTFTTLATQFGGSSVF